jgi:AcrR family transcriptional regulator
MAKETNRDKALVALIESPSIVEAANRCGLSKETLYRYLKDADFVKDYRAARRQTVETAIAQMQSAASESVRRLRELQYSENDAVAARCAQIIYESSVKGMETTDILERLEILENEFEKQSEATRNGNNRHKR